VRQAGRQAGRKAGTQTRITGHFFAHIHTRTRTNTHTHIHTVELMSTASYACTRDVNRFILMHVHTLTHLTHTIVCRAIIHDTSAREREREGERERDVRHTRRCCKLGKGLRGHRTGEEDDEEEDFMYTKQERGGRGGRDTRERVLRYFVFLQHRLVGGEGGVEREGNVGCVEKGEGGREFPRNTNAMCRCKKTETEPRAWLSFQSLCAGDALSLSLNHSKPAPRMSKCHKVAIQVQVSMCAYVRVCVRLLQSTVLITKLLA
jgi:hypothetical protein